MSVSVAMATYNGAQYIEEQLDSILRQLGPSDEVIISDDGSSDGTLDIIDCFAISDKRIHRIDGPQAGVIANFEHAISHCKGDYIFLADQDDIWMADKVQRVLACFADKSTSLVIHDAIVVNQDMSQTIMPSFFAYRGSRPGVWHSFIKNSYMGCCMAFRKELVDKLLPIPRNIPMHDQWIGLISDYCYGNSYFLREPLIKYRRHDKAVSDFDHNTVGVMLRNRILIYQEFRKRIRGIRKDI